MKHIYKMSDNEIECSYHECINILTDSITGEITQNYMYIDYWIGEDSEFNYNYLEIINEHAQAPLTDKETIYISKCGKNLEKVIEKWREETPNMPLNAMLIKVRKYIKDQFKKEELQNIFYPCECE